MSQITWKNINAPNITGLTKIASDAYSDMGDTLDPIGDFMKRKQKQKNDAFMGEMTQIGVAAAEDNKDISSGSKAMYDAMVAKGADANMAMQKASEWEEGAGMLQSRFNKEAKTNTTNFMSGAKPTSHEDIDNLMAEGREKYGASFDENMARNIATRTLEGRRADINQMYADQERADTSFMNTQMGNAFTMFSQGVPRDQIMNKIMQGTDAKLKPQMGQKMNALFESYSKMTGEERVEMEFAMNEMNVKKDQLNLAHQEQIGRYETQIQENQLPTSPETSQIEEALQTKGINNTLSDIFEKGATSGAVNGLLNIFDRGSSTGTSAKTYAKNSINELLKDSTLTKDEAYKVWSAALKETSERAALGNRLRTKDFEDSIKMYKTNILNQKQAQHHLRETKTRIAKEQAAFASKHNKVVATLGKQVAGFKKANIQKTWESVANSFHNSVDPIYEKAKREAELKKAKDARAERKREKEIEAEELKTPKRASFADGAPEETIYDGGSVLSNWIKKQKEKDPEKKRVRPITSFSSKR